MPDRRQGLPPGAMEAYMRQELPPLPDQNGSAARAHSPLPLPVPPPLPLPHAPREVPPRATPTPPARRPLPKPPGASASASPPVALPSGSSTQPSRTLPSVPRVPSASGSRPLPGLPPNPLPSSSSHASPSRSTSLSQSQTLTHTTPPTSVSHGSASASAGLKDGAYGVDGLGSTSYTPTPPSRARSPIENTTPQEFYSASGTPSISRSSTSSALPPLLPSTVGQPELLFSNQSQSRNGPPTPVAYHEARQQPAFRQDPYPVPESVGSESPLFPPDRHTSQSHRYEQSQSRLQYEQEQQDYEPGSSRHPQALALGRQSMDSTDRRRSSDLSPSWNAQSQQPSQWVERKLQIHQTHDEESIEDEWDEPEVEEIHFFQPALLSEAAVQLRDRVERRRHLKGGIAWAGSFTGKDIVTTIQSFLPPYVRETVADRRFALLMAQSLQNQLWFVEVDWDIKPLRDSSEDVFRFMGELEGMAGDALTSELPKGLMTMATRCYAPSCSGDGKCYAPRCPHKTSPSTFLHTRPASPVPEQREQRGDWTDELDPRLLRDLTQEQMNRQTIIRQAITSEIQYEQDLTAMYNYVMGLREAQVIPFYRIETFISEVFGNAMELREACRRLIDHFSIRQREQAPLIRTVGDIFLEAATEFRIVYPEYTGNFPGAEAAVKKELEDNAEFRLFNERVVRENDRRRDIKYLIARPTNQLQRYPAVIEAILNATSEGDPDLDFLQEALASIRNLSVISQLKVIHATRGKGMKKEWFDLVPEDQRNAMPKKEQKRQMQIWELIQGEMEYVSDLSVMEDLFVAGLREADVPIIERSRLEIFLDDAFHNYRSLLEVHAGLLDKLQTRQLEQHPQIGSISDLVFDAALNWQEAYMEYVTHYPIAKAKVQEEQTKNPRFAAFLESCLRSPMSNRQDIYHFINRPIPRLLRYNLLLADILKSLREVDPDHPDIETIPQVMELIADLGKATQKGVAVNEAKVELWTFQHSLDGGKFGSRAVRDLDLLNPMRELIYKGRVFRQPESIGTSWIELLLLLFDNYLVLAKPEKSSRRREGSAGHPVRYVINRRPIPLELLSLGVFGEAPRNRPTGKLFGVGAAGVAGQGASGTNGEVSYSGTSEEDTRSIWPFNILFIGQGQLGGQYTLFTESYKYRAEWQDKLEHAKVLRAEVNDAGKVFEMTPLSLDTFLVPPNYTVIKEGDNYTGQVTCSAPFVTPDGRSLVAIGCEEGVWIGLRGDAKSLRKVLHVKAVTSLAVLEEFGIFLVLQDKSLLAYHLEALVPSASSPQVRAAPQRLSPGKDIVFFTVGQLSGRTLVLYMKKKGMDSLFRVLEPIMNRGDDSQRQQRRPFGNILGQRAEWFRLYKDFFIPTEALAVHFLKHKLAVVCAKGFEIMDLTDLKGGSIPIFDPAKLRDRPHLADLQRRCDAAKPLGMFRSTETEFFLVYDSFGLYVDRHGEPNRSQEAIEWEGRPDSVAFHPPYLLLVSAQFIEIRHIDTAKLVQIYTGTDIRLAWDGTGGMARPFIDNPGPKGYGDEATSQDPRIHISQRAENGRTRHGIVQHVYELTPTLLLNNPLLNPIHTHDSNYFPPAPLMGGMAGMGLSGVGGSISSNHSSMWQGQLTPLVPIQAGHYQPQQQQQQQQLHMLQNQQQQQGQGQGYQHGHNRASSISTTRSEYYYRQQQQQQQQQGGQGPPGSAGLPPLHTSGQGQGQAHGQGMYQMPNPSPYQHRSSVPGPGQGQYNGQGPGPYSGTSGQYTGYSERDREPSWNGH